MSKNNSTYKIFLLRRAEKDLERLATPTLRRVKKAMTTLATQPRPTHAKKLVGGTDQYRLRLGNYRLLYTIDDTKRKIVIYQIGHRQGVYKT